MRHDPDLIQGAWKRKSVAIDGGPHFETQHVIWLQAGTVYADIRVPFHPDAEERCFTGHSGWDGDQYRWTHQLDLEGPDSPAADDLGDLSWESGLLIERGTFPTTSGAVLYEELWERLPGDDGPWAAEESPTSCFVRVGDHAMRVIVEDGRVAACYQTLKVDGWHAVLAIGDLHVAPV